MADFPPEKDLKPLARKASSDDGPTSSQISTAQVGREHLSDAVAPHESYEGRHRYDPGATWTEQEERRVLWKTDLYLLGWLCVMVRGCSNNTITLNLTVCSSSAFNSIVSRN